MSFTQKSEKYAKTPIINEIYASDEGGTFHSAIPERCPRWQKEEQCKIKRTGSRHRKYGPGFALDRHSCETHAISFSVYPPGWVRFARKALVILSVGGSRILDLSFDLAWASSLFSAVFSAANEVRWPQERNLGVLAEHSEGAGCFRTQIRCLSGVLRLFALNRESTIRDREIIGSRLCVDIALLEGHHKRIRDGPSLKNCGTAVMEILRILAPTASNYQTLLMLGARTGFWGFPLAD